MAILEASCPSRTGLTGASPLVVGHLEAFLLASCPSEMDPIKASP